TEPRMHRYGAAPPICAAPRSATTAPSAARRQRREVRVDVEAGAADLVVAAAGEAAGGGEVRRRLRLAALVVRVALEVAGAVGLAHGAAVRLDDAAREVEAAAPPVRGAAAFGVRRTFVVILDRERVQREDERVDALLGGLVVGEPAVAVAALPCGRERCLCYDDAAAGEQAEDVPAVPGRGIDAVRDVVRDHDVARGRERHAP